MSEHDAQGHTDAHTDHAGDDHEHHGNMKTFVGVFLTLCFLTACSFGVANSPLMATPSVGWAMMLAISCGKAMLVITFFMHLLWEANWKFVLTIPASMMSVFLVVMLIPDIGLRTRNYSETRWRYAAEPQDDHGAEQEDSAAARAAEDDAGEGKAAEEAEE